MNKTELLKKQLQRDIKIKALALQAATEALNAGVAIDLDTEELGRRYQQVDRLWIELKTMLNVRDYWKE